MDNFFVWHRFCVRMRWRGACPQYSAANVQTRTTCTEDCGDFPSLHTENKWSGTGWPIFNTEKYEV